MPDTNDRTERADGWQLDGNSAESYERYLVPRMFEPWADELVERAALEPGHRVLDVGCGTGIVARRAASAVGPEGEVVGIDPNEGMLDVARAAPVDPPSAVDWRRGEAAELPFSDEAFDAVCCQQVLQFVADPAAALREMRRVLTADGRLALNVWRPIGFHRSYVTLAETLERYVGEEAATMMRSPFPSWNRPDLRELVEGAGFRDATVRIGIGSMRYPSPEEFVRREAASSPLAGPLGAIGRDVRDALVRRVGEELREYTDDEGVVFPMEAYVVTARR